MSDIHTVEGARFIAADDMIVAHIRRTKAAFEPDTALFIAWALAEKPGILVDVGASTGFYTVPAAQSGRRVMAIEPNPAIIPRLAANLALNGCAHLVEIVQAAASDRDGTATLYVNPRVPLTSGASIEVATCSAPRKVTVPTRRLDDLLAETGEISCIKIDVEGHERAVLRGAAGIIARHRPALVCEANTAEHVAALIGDLTALGYSARLVDARNLLAVPA